MSVTRRDSARPLHPSELAARFSAIRAQSLHLAAPLSAEDQTVQSIPDTSPTKWHLAHTTWFFETFILQPNDPAYRVFDPAFNFLFNSYYEQIGPRHARPMRGLLTRPALETVHTYREHVDAAITSLLATGPANSILETLELGLHHEQQHQELLLTDIKHVLSCNPTSPAYRAPRPREAQQVRDLSWIDHPGGLVSIGTDGPSFHFDCEGPRHKVWLEPFRIASRPVTNAEYTAFINDGGYARPEFWLSEGWAKCQEEGWEAPLYWRRDDEHGWRIFTLLGLRPIYPDAPVCHVSYYEADAFARWAGKRLPTEAEWEVIAEDLPTDGHFVGTEAFHPLPAPDDGLVQMFGDVWEWTQSAYAPYPGFSPAEGAVGEYNGKFMSGQMILRGGSCVTPESHIRPSYRNFFYPPDRWQFSGIRLAEDDTSKTHQVPTANDSGTDSEFMRDALSGLQATPKTLPPKYFYDAEGARLFTEICTLDAYYQTRTETKILNDNAPAIAAAIGPRTMLVEYGCGSLDKVRILLDALEDPIALAAIDISAQQLARAANDVSASYPDVEVFPVEADFTQPVPLPDPAEPIESRTAFFPGSTIGNFDPDDARDFLSAVAKTVGPGGLLLIGVDQKKDVKRLLTAYDDAEGVTAAFNLNLLTRMNRELGADFDPDLFTHVARYDDVQGRIEMHLQSRIDQLVRVGDQRVHFAPGETVHTENSYKYTPDEFSGLAESAGFATEAVWTDADDLFSVILLRAQA